MRDGIDPCSAVEALARMDALKTEQMPYCLGTGNYDPKHPLTPWTYSSKYDLTGSDCAGAAQCYAFKLVRHRPGFNHGDWATISDDINTNSGIEDALHKQELYTIVLEGPPLPGDLLAYPTIYITDADDGERHVFIGHVAMLKHIPVDWKPGEGYHRMTILQCCGGNNRKPAVIETDASTFDRHDAKWPKMKHRTQILRVKQAT
jgi:hypothetical protein